MPPKKENARVKIIDQISPEQGLSVLRNLWHAHPDVRGEIEAEVKKVLKKIDCAEVAGAVESDLDFPGPLGPNMGPP